MPPRPDSDGERASQSPKQQEGNAQARALPGCADFWNAEMNRWFMVCGRILDKYNEFGGPGGKLGPPTSDEITNPGNTGKRTSFRNDSSIYWSGTTDAHQIGGAIGAEWARQGWEGGNHGYPTTDELSTPGGGGKYNHFQKNSSIYYSPATGSAAYTVWGAIRETWAQAGWENSQHGFPKGNEFNYGGGKRQNFQYNVIDWNVAPNEQDVTTRVRNSPDPIRTLRALNAADLEAYKQGSWPRTATNSSGSATPIDVVAARERNLDVEKLTAPDAQPLPSESVPAEVDNSARAAAAPAGCYFKRVESKWRSRVGFDALAQWMTLQWCWNGTAVTSYDVSDRGGQGLVPGWNYIAQAGGGKQNFGWEARGYVNDTFGLGFGTAFTANTQLCTQVRGGGDKYSSRNTCNLTEA
ncbi:LGFP repeat-containing protein [Rhodococcus sp. 077-4]|uniref:LGFP repeat-containing protein n=1 Tax=Rhodococcus sp. 077-4 TaxID=2789271 RepID=UPI0039F4FE63